MNSQKSRDAVFLICNILFPLAMGAYIYVCWDTDSYFGNWVRSFLTIPQIDMDTDIMRIMRNWGCDFLFAYAVFFALYASEKNTAVSMKYAAICSVGLEFLQLIQVDFLKCGTFDIVDMFIELMAICVGATFLSCYNHAKRKRGRANYGR